VRDTNLGCLFFLSFTLFLLLISLIHSGSVSMSLVTENIIIQVSYSLLDYTSYFRLTWNWWLGRSTSSRLFSYSEWVRETAKGRKRKIWNELLHQHERQSTKKTMFTITD
jgi:hypothetical protein